MVACQSQFTDEDEEQLQRALKDAGKDTEQQAREQASRPEVQERVQERTMEYWEGRNADRRQQTNKANLSLIDKIDRDEWPTKREQQATFNTAKTLGMSIVQAANLPAVKVVGNNIDPEPLIENTLAQLHTSKLPRGMWEEYAVNKIAYIDHREIPDLPKNLHGYVRDADKLKDDPSLLQVVHLISDQNGMFPEGDELMWRLSHEIAHVHETDTDEKATGIFKAVSEYDPIRWTEAAQKQMESGPVSPYAIEDMFESDLDTEQILTHHEFVAEHFAAWATDSHRPGHAELCPEMRDYFDEAVPKLF